MVLFNTNRWFYRICLRLYQLMNPRTIWVFSSSTTPLSSGWDKNDAIIIVLHSTSSHHAQHYFLRLYIDVIIHRSDLWFLWICPVFRILYKSSFASKCSWKKRSSHQGKKEIACIVSKPSFLCVGMWRVCKSSKIKHPGGSGGFVL